jgi:predicted CoA-binding protein
MENEPKIMEAFAALTDDRIRAVLAARPVIALVGASRKPHRASHSVMRALLDEGYDVVPVHPRGGEVHGREVFADLTAIPRPVDLVDVFRRADQTREVARQAVAIGARVLWLQLGIVSDEAAAIARAGGLEVIMDRCTIIEHRRLVGRPFPRAGGSDIMDRIGLCFDCRYARTVPTPRSTFWLCGLSAVDPSFPKYPRLPVVACRGYEPGKPVDS